MCAPFIKERRMKLAEPTKLRRKSGIWGTLVRVTDIFQKLISHSDLLFL
jgi:hypothetical protein